MKITVIRANADSSFGRQHRDQAVAVDEHKCLIFLIKGGDPNWLNPNFVPNVNVHDRSVYQSLQETYCKCCGQRTHNTEGE